MSSKKKKLFNILGEGEGWTESCRRPRTEIIYPTKNPAEELYAFSNLSKSSKNYLNVDQFNHSSNHKEHSRCISKFRFFYSFVDIREISRLSQSQWESLPNVFINFTKETTSDINSKYCLSNPLNNVPWAKENSEKPKEELKLTRFESPPIPDLTNWAALFLENNPSH